MAGRAGALRAAANASAQHCWRGQRRCDRRCAAAAASGGGAASASAGAGAGASTSGSGSGGGAEGDAAGEAGAAVAVAAGASRRKLVFPDLQPNDFRHPLDRQNTTLLRAIPGLSALTRAAIGPVSEEMMVFDNIASSVRVSESQLPEMHALLTEACAILAIREPPDLYLKQSPSVNAYTLAVDGQKPFIVLHTALVELLNEAEQQAVIAHELAHIKCDHGTWLTSANLVMLSVNVLPGIGSMLSRQFEDGLLSWFRSAELTCDRGALLVAQDHKVVISAMMKMAGGTKSIAENLR